MGNCSSPTQFKKNQYDAYICELRCLHIDTMNEVFMRNTYDDKEFKKHKMSSFNLINSCEDRRLLKRAFVLLPFTEKGISNIVIEYCGDRETVLLQRCREEGSSEDEISIIKAKYDVQ